MHLYLEWDYLIYLDSLRGPPDSPGGRLAARAVRVPHRPVVTAALVILPSTELDSEGAPKGGVYLKDGGLPASHHWRAMSAENEELLIYTLLQFCSLPLSAWCYPWDTSLT